jgi:hypothetical protein
MVMLMMMLLMMPLLRASRAVATTRHVAADRPLTYGVTMSLKAATTSVRLDYM